MTIEGEGDEDFINLVEVGPNASTTIRGGTENDVIQIAGDELAATSTTVVDGEAPSNVADGDTLLFDPGDPNATINPNDAGPSGSLGVAGLGDVDFTDIEDVQVIAAPTINLQADLVQISEGDGLDFAVTFDAGTNNDLSDPVGWDLDGDGLFGDETGLAISVNWSTLSTFYGIDDGPLTRTIAVRATNTQGFTSVERFTLEVINALPVVSITSDDTITVGADYLLSFSSSDPGADTPLSWVVDWGDGSSQTYGASVTSATHVYDEPDDYNVTVGVIDEDSAPVVADDEVKQVTVTVAATGVSAGGPYVISEGDDLELFGTAVATPTNVQWDLNDDGNFNDASGLSPGVTWDFLQNGGIDNSATDLPIVVRVSYANGQIIDSTTTLDITNVAPTATFTNDAPAGGVDEGPGSGVLVSFSNVTDPSDADSQSLRFSYDFGNDDTFEVVNTLDFRLLPSRLRFTKIAACWSSAVLSPMTKAKTNT